MENQKIENVMNLALDATSEERERSLDLNVGYDGDMKSWELIIKYSGDLERFRGKYSFHELLNEYAIIELPESQFQELMDEPEVEYIEKPKNLFYNRVNGMRVSCITALQKSESGLKGRGVLVAVIDSGIDYMNTEFRTEDGTRILYLWDQSLGSGFDEMGTVYDKEDINRAINASNNEERLEIVPSVDSSGHGTEVASIAAGNNGVASETDIIVVKLGVPQKGGFPRTIELMKGLDFVVRKALELRQPVVINLSFGNTYGAHDGSSLLERYIDDISNYWKVSIIVSSGNEGISAGHVRGTLKEGISQGIELGIDNRQSGTNIQLWKRYEDDVNVSLVSPSGERIGTFKNQLGVQRYYWKDTEILVYYGVPSPYSAKQEIYIEMIPEQDYIGAGVWELILEPVKLVTGEYDLWLPSAVVLSGGTGFLRPNKEGTITIPATASKVITVGAYDALTMNYADFSGRGISRNYEGIKPDIIAPGVDIIVTSVNENVRIVSGTSYSAPFVSGAAAMLMEWGIVKGNDPFMYGEKIKAYLRKGAIRRGDISLYPNIEEGYGRLCVENSLDI